MKKLLLGALLLLSMCVNAQETFVVKYHSYITMNNSVKEPWVYANMTAVFNEKDTGDTVLYYAEGKTIRFRQVTGAEKEITTVGNQEYQFMEGIDSDSGRIVGIQYFTGTETLRIIIEKGYYIEFHK